MAIPVDPGTGLVDLIDVINLEGASGLHQRFKNLYDQFNGQIAHDNLLLSDNYPWTGVHSFTDASVTRLQASSLQTPTSGWMSNLSLKKATTTTAGDSIKLSGYDGTALSALNPAYVVLPDKSCVGGFQKFTLTSDITIKISAAHWGKDTKGDALTQILRVGFINDNSATPALAVYVMGGRKNVRASNCSATQTDITTDKKVLTSRAISGAATYWPIQEVGYLKANFTDATNVWAVYSTADFDSIYLGRSADGIFQPWNPTFFGFSVNPTMSSKWAQVGNTIHVICISSVAGTSNSTSFQISVPVFGDALDNSPVFSVPYAKNNGAVTATGGSGEVGANFILYPDNNFGTSTWTNVNSKTASFITSYGLSWFGD